MGFGVFNGMRGNCFHNRVNAEQECLVCLRDKISDLFCSGWDSRVCCHMWLGLYGEVACVDSRLGFVEVRICFFICLGSVVRISKEVGWLFILGDGGDGGCSVEYIPWVRICIRWFGEDHWYCCDVSVSRWWLIWW